MKTKFFSIMCIWVTTLCYSQFGEQLIITEEAMWARSVFAADIDGDDDLDVLSASEHDDKIAWYENLDGLGSFGTQNIITNTLNSSVDVFAADLDGDLDIDVLVASKGPSSQDSKVVWFQNLDGQGTFGNEIIISDEILGAIAVYAADIDGDNDLDVLSASYTDNIVAWYENTDGMGTFAPRQIITASALSVRDVIAVDLDGDNDIDVLTVSPGSDEVLWFQNLDGQGAFGTAQVVNANTNGALAIFAADMDGDSYLDVLSVSPADDSVYWYKNLDGLGNFGVENVVTQNLISAQTVFAADLDNDLDIDILSGSGIDDKVVWFENLDGLGSFSTEKIISTETDWASSIIVADIDDDNLLDVLSASRVDNKIAWYKNSGVFGLQDFLSDSIEIYPNPTQDTLTIKAKNVTITSIELMDLLGKKLLTAKGNINVIDVSTIQSGVLFVKVVTEQGTLIKRIIKD